MIKFLKLEFVTGAAGKQQLLSVTQGAAPTSDEMVIAPNLQNNHQNKVIVVLHSSKLIKASFGLLHYTHALSDASP